MNTETLSTEQLQALIKRMEDMLIIRNNCLRQIYDSIEHEEDEGLQRLTKITIAGLNAGTGNLYDTERVEDLAWNLRIVSGLEEAVSAVKREV